MPILEGTTAAEHVRAPESRAGLELTPAQTKAADHLKKLISACSLAVLRTAGGFGRTTILRSVCAELGGGFIAMGELVHRLELRGGIEEAFLDLLRDALSRHDIVFVDDLHLITFVTDSASYPRENLLEIVLTAIIARAEAPGKKLVFGTYAGRAPYPLARVGPAARIPEFLEADYQVIAKSVLGAEKAAALAFDQIYRTAPHLNAHQLRRGFEYLAAEDCCGTKEFLEYLTRYQLVSNVDTRQVREVTFSELKGMDDVITALDAKIARPLENDALAVQFKLKPKRGVLLAGPPGTGKTTIGRALAHRLKSKFFLIDGTVIAGTGDFYQNVKEIFDDAIANAPSVVFIDDGDVIFEKGGDQGLYRYLLTMLDGLETASADGVCVIITAMDSTSLPPAMLRSGRIELWLETRLPDEAARESIFTGKLAGLPAPFDHADSARLAAAAHGLTGADLNAVIEDGKLLFADDLVNGRPLKPVEEYFLDAIQTVRSHHRSNARRKPVRPGDTMTMGFVETSHARR